MNADNTIPWISTNLRAHEIANLKAEFLEIAERAGDNLENAAHAFDSFLLVSPDSVSSEQGELVDAVSDSVGITPRQHEKDKRNEENANCFTERHPERTEDEFLDLLCEMSIDELYFLRRGLALDLEWIEKTIARRKSFLKYKYASTY
ncbi:unnamed protein product [Mesocestoides corti]|uniref:Adenylosuccinate lyase n=1 Tax=Mesocestoides corti TaxID=53468 RepID=A0A0R3UED3_MESCO|nr:unnamed protein product [Mesocestoides corti]